MKKARLTINEVNEFNPTFDNPLVVECDDGAYFRDLEKIKIITREHNGVVSIINNEGRLRVFEGWLLNHYPSLKDEPRTEVLYECWNSCGDPDLRNSKGEFPMFVEKEFSVSAHPENLKRKTGRTVKLNLDTWEPVE